MIEFISEYGLFLAKALTILVFIWLLISLIFSFSKKTRGDNHLEITHLNEKYKSMSDSLRFSLLTKKELKMAKKTAQKGNKTRKKIYKKYRQKTHLCIKFFRQH